MHVTHLALGPDVITSCLLDWSDCAGYVDGASREKRLESLWKIYRSWCESCSVSDRAQRRLFTSNILKPDSGSYVEISQKTLSATASRYMIMWVSSLAKQFAETIGNDTDMRLDPFYRLSKFSTIPPMCWYTLKSVEGWFKKSCSKKRFTDLFGGAPGDSVFVDSLYL